MMPTDSPITVEMIDGLPEKLREALGLIAVNQDGWVHSKRTLKELLKRGLIESYEERIFGTGNSPIDRISVVVTRYEVPFPVHMAWCQWCSLHP